MSALWLQVDDPANRTSGLATRSALLAQRKHERLHFFDRYDLDGDGVVRCPSLLLFLIKYC